MRTLTFILFASLACFLMSATASAEELTFDQIVTRLQETKIGKVEFKDEPIQVVVNYLAESTGINYVLTDKVLEDDVRVTLSLGEGMSIYNVMKVIGKLKGLKYYFDSGIVIILLEDDYSMDEMVMRVYNLSVYQPVKTTDFPGPELTNMANRQQESNYFDDKQSEETGFSPEEMKDMILKMCGGTSWENNEKVKITLRGEMLIVVQSAEVQEEIVKLLTSFQN